MIEDTHSCSLYCDRLGCIHAQRDDLRERVAELQENGARLLDVANGAAAECIALRERVAELKVALLEEAAKRIPLMQEAHELRERVSELEKDAARYRWLRDGCCNKDSIASRIVKHEYGMHWDAAIDAAMKG